jgi:hypothetical protein
LHHLLSETNEIQRQAQIEENISPSPLSREEEEEKEQATPVAVPSLSLLTEGARTRAWTICSKTAPNDEEIRSK